MSPSLIIATVKSIAKDYPNHSVYYSVVSGVEMIFARTKNEIILFSDLDSNGNLILRETPLVIKV